jgi:hypothetical protein
MATEVSKIGVHIEGGNVFSRDELFNCENRLSVADYVTNIVKVHTNFMELSPFFEKPPVIKPLKFSQCFM